MRINEAGINYPFTYAPVAKGYLSDDASSITTAPTGVGDWPAGWDAKAMFDFWANIKSMYYHISAAIGTEQAIEGEAGGFGIGAGMFGGTRTGNVVGITRRFWDYPSGTPGEHRTYRGVGGIVQSNSVGDVRISFVKSFFGSQSKAPAGWYWYPMIHIEATMSGMEVINGGTDGYFSFRNPPGITGAMPSVPDVGITVTAGKGSGTPIGNVSVIASDIKPIERYDDISFEPMFGPPGTLVTITLPACSAAFDGSNLREAFKFVKEMWIGETRIDTFTPASSIQGAFKDIIKVVIPTGASTGAFRFRAAYTTIGTDDRYNTRDKFMVR